MTKKSKRKELLRWNKKKIFIIFKGLLLKQIKRNFLGRRESDFKLHHFNVSSGCFIVSYLWFYNLGWSASKIYDRYLWMGLTPSQVEDSLSEIFLGVYLSAKYYVINFARIFLETTFIVFKFFISCVVFSCI